MRDDLHGTIGAKWQLTVEFVTDALQQTVDTSSTVAEHRAKVFQTDQSLVGVHLARPFLKVLTMRISKRQSKEYNWLSQCQLDRQVLI